MRAAAMDSLAPHLDHTQPSETEGRVASLVGGNHPHAEEVLLGSILAHDGFAEAADTVRSSFFCSEATQTIWAAAEFLSLQGLKVDVASVWDWLVGNGKTNKVSFPYLASLTRLGFSAGSIELHAHRVADNFLSRQLITASGQIQQLAYSPGEAVERLANAQSVLMGMDESVVAKNGPRMLGEAIEEVEAMIAQAQHNGLIGAPTGYASFDKLTGGLVPGDLIVIGGRPSMGKTTFVEGIAGYITGMHSIDARPRSQSAEPVFMFSQEMKSAALMLRGLARYSGVPLSDIRSGGSLSARQVERIEAAKSMISRSPFIVDDRRGLGLAQMISTATREFVRRPYKVLIIDYLQLIRQEDGQRRSGDNENIWISRVTFALKTLAGRLGIPVILLSQLSRRLEERQDKRPLMSDLRDSGAIEQDADIIAFPYRDIVYNPLADPGEAEVIVRKGRNSGIGVAKMRFDGPTVSFIDHDESGYFRGAPASTTAIPHYNPSDDRDVDDVLR